jgi:hypothetical protein
MTSQSTLPQFASPVPEGAGDAPEEEPLSSTRTQEVLVYRYHCQSCDTAFLSPGTTQECVNCDRKHPTNLGFLGDADLATAVEAADVDVSPQTLDAAGAVDALRSAGEPIPGAFGTVSMEAPA